MDEQVKKEFEQFAQEKGKETLERIRKTAEEKKKINRPPLKLIICGVRIKNTEKFPQSADAVTSLE